MFSSARVLVVLVLVCAGTHAQEVDISVSVNSNELDINIENYNNPCDGHECRTGEKCEPVFTPQLMQLPVAHCISVKQDSESPCVEYHVNANLLSCKTTEQWEKVGDNQCKLRGEQTHSMLTNTQVLYKCHSMSLERKYLRATFTCCSTHTTVPPSPPKDSQKPGLEKVASPTIQSTEAEQSSHLGRHLVPVLVGSLVLLTIVALLLVVWQRRSSRRRRSQKPKVAFATSFVNPAADEHDTHADWVFNPLDTTDKSLLIVNPSN
ncbi:uncharacterized protein LOC135346761 [Halichondria panicea]|uniref:uncharacterized protein LOC135346761 n=1 Tax=Halichondria panicea TaxID=6063 RepID=UPI00312B6AFB